ncbi:Exostosin, GT47 domain [Dillenia turbinata]|uniref:Exostosin, GT47 domain n=1 Tax=Dillenia turbinata TaxID=194707 RepID=A0AAN8VPM0_9MAGN
MMNWIGGSKLIQLPESRNMTILSIESSPFNSNDFAVPYLTYLHPSSDEQVLEWQNSMRHQKREYLFAFAGVQTPIMTDSVRREIVEQCHASSTYCKLLDSNSSTNCNCYNPQNVMKLFQSSPFCLRPAGNSYTRRSPFDSILAGCIPVFFQPGSPYVQYLWHLPENYSKYSVLIADEWVMPKNDSIEKMLLGIQVPRLESIEDACDIAVTRVLKRAETGQRLERGGAMTNIVHSLGRNMLCDEERILVALTFTISALLCLCRC